MDSVTNLILKVDELEKDFIKFESKLKELEKIILKFNVAFNSLNHEIETMLKEIENIKYPLD